MNPKFDYLNISRPVTTSELYNIEALSNIEGTSRDSTIDGVAHVNGGKTEYINFDSNDVSVDEKAYFRFLNYNPYGHDESGFTTLKISNIVRGKFAINDTTFPPPPEIITSAVQSNVDDKHDEFFIQDITLTRSSDQTFSVDITLASDDSDMFIANNPECKIQEFTFDSGKKSKALLLYVIKVDQGIPTPTFHQDVDFSNISSGLPILVVEGNPDIDAALPNNMMKKGLIWVN